MFASAQTGNFRQFSMKRETVSQETFYRKLSQTFKSSKDVDLGCSRLRCGDQRCVGVLVCPGVCHLCGVFNITQPSAPGADVNSCDVYTIVSFERVTCVNITRVNV